ncbi:MAG: DinB family protein [Cyclobacteriaceae bacterium]
MKLPSELAALFERDIEKLSDELNGYKNEDDIWVTKGEIKNSAGTLFLHLCGNLKHFIGATLDNTGYVRDREFEFAGKVTKEELANGIQETKEMLANYFDRVSIDDMSDPYPLQPFGYPMTKSQFIIHLYGHLSYHMGQVNYHRRLIG